MSKRLLLTILQPHTTSKSSTLNLQTTSHHTSLHIARCRAGHYSTQISRSPTPTSTSTPKKSDLTHTNPSLPSFNLFHEVRNARPFVRYTVYAGLGLMATVESTFWFNVIKAKFFPSSSEEEQDKAEELLASIRHAIEGYKATWMTNYGRYYGSYVWGVGER